MDWKRLRIFLNCGEPIQEQVKSLYIAGSAKYREQRAFPSDGKKMRD